MENIIILKLGIHLVCNILYDGFPFENLCTSKTDVSILFSLNDFIVFTMPLFNFHIN